MSEIDVQNSRQIRDPMDVLITMEVPATDITLTYSGYSSAKVADGILGESTWPMRLLADLKGDGFPLDGTRVVYDPNTTASATNGKIGVRSNIGQSASITVSGNRTISSLSIFATGAESVTYNGTTSAIVGGQVIIPVGARSITLTFNPASTTERIEVSEISAGTTIRISNENIVKCVLSLRSDLQPIDPTLPESELNVEAYNDADISETVANLPEDTPITYQAGYEGDMSPIRKFYVSGQVTWADNILSIHAVDAIHLLDVDMFPFVIGSIWEGEFKPAVQKGGPHKLYNAFVDQFRMAGINAEVQTAPSFDIGVATDVTHTFSLCERQNRRDLIANMMNIFRYQRTAQPVPFEMWLNYVDAGRPKVTWGVPQPSFDIYEEDCGDVEKTAAPKIGQIVYESGQIESSGQSETLEIGSGTLLHSSRTAFPDYPEFCESMILFATKEEGNVTNRRSVMYFYEDGEYNGFPTMLPLRTEYGPEDFYETSYGKFLLDNDAGTNSLAAPRFIDSTRAVPWSWITSEVLSSSAFNSLVQNGYVNPEESSSNLELRGREIILTKRTKTAGNAANGIVAYPSKTHWYGEIVVVREASGSFATYSDLVYLGMYNLTQRSPITCSFTWKGDPRIQPRDVFTFHRLDGTDEDWTFENITLTHEKGGTVAEITARKGIV